MLVGREVWYCSISFVSSICDRALSWTCAATGHVRNVGGGSQAFVVVAFESAALTIFG